MNAYQTFSTPNRRHLLEEFQYAPDSAWFAQDTVAAIRDCSLATIERDRWAYILESIGVPHRYLKNQHGPCPMCGGKDRFRFDDKEGRSTFYCNQCGSGDGVTFLRNYCNCGFIDAIRMIANSIGYQLHENQYAPRRHIGAHFAKMNGQSESIPNPNAIKIQREKLQAVWNAARPVIHSDPVAQYLGKRGLTLDQYPNVLRHHPALEYYEKKKVLGSFPAMLALVQNLNGELIALHRTYLDGGNKAKVPSPRKIMPPIFQGAVSGTAIQLKQPENGILAIAEGIESALAFYIATKIPTWSSITAGGMESILLPDSVTEVIIAVDNDERGQHAAQTLATRLLQDRRKVRRVMPPKQGHDFNDMLLEEIENVH